MFGNIMKTFKRMFKREKRKSIDAPVITERMKKPDITDEKRERFSPSGMNWNKECRNGHSRGPGPGAIDKNGCWKNKSMCNRAFRRKFKLT